MKVRTILRVSSWIFLLGGCLALGTYAFRIGQAEVYKVRDTARLASLLKQPAPAAPIARSRPAALVEPALKTGAVLGELEIPRLGIDTIVFEGDSKSILSRGAGHIPGTAMPDSLAGNVGIAAHRDTYFRPLRFIRAGDEIILRTSVGRYQYRVQSTHVVEPTDVAAIGNKGKAMLTLVTCYPFFYVGPAPHRFIVWATETSSTAQ